jgi:hypothetical protein
MNVHGTRLQASGSPRDVVLEVAERRIVPGEIARFPFSVNTGQRAPSIHDFQVVSDNPKFDPAWAHIVRYTNSAPPSYTLEIRPRGIRPTPYGTYPLHIYWGGSGAPVYAEGLCTLIVRPCLKLAGKPTLKTWPGGSLSLSLRNCGGIGMDVSVSIRHRGSDWSQGWDFELKTKEGPFEFSERFVPPAGGHRGSFDLEISAEGFSLIRLPIGPTNWIVSRRIVTTSAVVLVGAAVGTRLAFPWPEPPHSQTIAFTSIPPAGAGPGQTYPVAARGGASGNLVIFTVDPSSTSTCSVSGATVTFRRPGTCVIDANQAGNDDYAAAAQVQQTITVVDVTKTQQRISFTPPARAVAGGSATLSAKGGKSGKPVVFTVDASSDPGVCRVSGTHGRRVTFVAAGGCVIDANQAGNSSYAAAPEVQGKITVGKRAQSISSFAPPASAAVGDGRTLFARGGGSGIPVVFTVDPTSAKVCAVSGTNGIRVTFVAAGSCVIKANQAGNGSYATAPEIRRTITVGKRPQSISFTPPASALVRERDILSAQGGGSGSPVVFSVDPVSERVCSVSGANGTTVRYLAAGSCVINANQAGNGTYAAAPQVQRTIDVRKRAQSITFTPPATGYVKYRATLSAEGGDSGSPVVFTVEPKSKDVCSIDGSTVNYNAPGECVINADQEGNDVYEAAPQVTRTIQVDYNNYVG